MTPRRDTSEQRPIALTRAGDSPDYCTIAEVAGGLRVTAKRVRNMMAAGIFVEGEHYFRRAGISPRFRWSRVVEWLETPVAHPDDTIPMASSRRRVAGLRPADL
jgi:hypothetical protein